MWRAATSPPQPRVGMAATFSMSRCREMFSQSTPSAATSRRSDQAPAGRTAGRRSFRDQLDHADAIPPNTLASIDKMIAKAEQYLEQSKEASARAQPCAAENQLRGDQYAELRDALVELRESI
jgi:hypothetical protein